MKIWSKSFTKTLAEGGITVEEDWVIASDSDVTYIKLMKESPALAGGIIFGDVDTWKYGQRASSPGNDPVTRAAGRRLAHFLSLSLSLSRSVSLSFPLRGVFQAVRN